MATVIRDAEQKDAEGISRVYAASITELCGADHNDDSQRIAAWTANKTPENIKQWLGNADLTMIVAEADAAIVGVASFSGDSIMTLYVAPDRRFSGVSKALLAHIEQSMSESGVTIGSLTSTATAHDFYLARGWRDSGPPVNEFGVHCFPMLKTLRAREIVA